MTTLISRADAATKIREHMLTAWGPVNDFAREQLLAAYEPDWERLRNYELESRLEKRFGGEWCISEWCPFNGVYCTWKGHAPDDVIEATALRFERDAAALRADGYNPEAMAEYVRHRGQTFTCSNCRVGVYGQGPGLCAKCSAESPKQSEEQNE